MTQLEANTASLQAILDTVNNLPEAGSGEPELQAKTVSPTTSQQTVTPDSGYDGLSSVTVNAMPTVEQATPEITVFSNTGLVEAIATQAEGYVQSGAKSSRYFLNVDSGGRITPGTSGRTVPKGVFLTGAIEVPGDTDLVPSNIKKGVNIFGVTGSYDAADVKTETLNVIPDGYTTTYHPSSGYYYSSVKVYGDDNLTPSNIKSGVTIYGVTGSYTGAGSGGTDGGDLNSFLNGTITAVTVPSGVEKIKKYLFEDCASLTTVSLPDSVTHIHEGAFYDCSSLVSINLSDDITDIDKYAFRNCDNLILEDLPNNLEGIGDYAFAYCYNITPTDLPSDVTYVGEYAFRGCKSLSNFYIRSDVSVGRYAFRDCTGLAYVSVASSSSRQTSLGTGVFRGCTNLKYAWVSEYCDISDAISATSAPFCYCHDDLVIYTNAVTDGVDWGEYWNRTGSSGAIIATVVRGVTRSKFLTIMDSLEDTWTFSIGVNSFNSEEKTFSFKPGMSMEMFINSEYNTDAFFSYSSPYVRYNGLVVDGALFSTLIEDGAVYYLASSGGNGGSSD